VRKEILEYIACPTCKVALDLEGPITQEGEHIMSGALRCHECFGTYPIILGVPRLLPSTTRSQDLAVGRAYTDYYSVIAPGGTLGDDTLYSITVDEELDDFCTKTNLGDWRLLDGKVFLDAGCGLGRIDGALAEYCRVVVAFDITPAVEQAFMAWRELPNIHIVQGDLTSAPLLPGCFDFVWCDGALPYVSDFEAALTELLKSRSPTGFLYSWCNGSTITMSQRLGRLFHAIGLPVKIRFILIYATCWAIKMAVTIKHRRNLLKNVRSFAEGVLDSSLAHQVNHASEAQVRSIISEHVLDKDVPVQVTTKGKLVKFQVGSVNFDIAMRSDSGGK